MDIFTYGEIRVKDMQPNVIKTLEGKERIGSFMINGKKVRPTKRFWKSFKNRFGISSNIFRYFEHAEVFNRISERRKEDDVIRFCIHEADGRAPELLGVTNPKAQTFKYNSLMELLQSVEGKEGVEYSDGRVISKHAPRVGAEPLAIGGDLFENRFVVETPIDGYGKPSIYLSILRVVCTNGAVGYGKAFRSQVPTGKDDADMAHNLIRAMEGYNNEEGYGALRSRFESAQTSWASVREAQRLYKLLARTIGAGDLLPQDDRGYEASLSGGPGEADASGGNKVIKSSLNVLHNFHKMTGDLQCIYSMTNMETLPPKKQRILPVKCTVYDVLNFISEVASHIATPSGARVLQAMIGEIVGDPGGFDLEGTVEAYPDFTDFFIKDREVTGQLRDMSRKSTIVD